MIKFKDSINLALDHSLRSNKRLICFGLGVNDPYRFFETTKNLLEKYGENRVFETPTSENAMTGIGIGLAINNYPCVMMHQRLDFFLLAMDQLVNNAAKWHFMYGGKKSVPITIRLIIGKGWGQGPTHSQSLQSWFAHIPGLKVVMPSSNRKRMGSRTNPLTKFTKLVCPYSWIKSCYAVTTIKCLFFAYSKHKRS